MPKKRRFEVRVTVSLPQVLVEWLEEGVRKGFFASISHGIRQCVSLAKTYMPEVSVKAEEEK